MQTYSPGLDLTRALIAKALHLAEPARAASWAAEQWGARSNAVVLTKTGISDIDAPDLLGNDLLSAAQAEFLEAVNDLTILGRLQGLRRVKPGMPYCPLSQASQAYWRGQSKPLKASRLAFSRETLPGMSVGAMVLATKEALRAEGRGVELIRRDLIRALVAATDSAFIDETNNGVSGVTPAAVTYNAPAVSSSGDVADDLGAAIESFTGDLAAAAWVMHPRLAADIALRTGGAGIGADFGVRGGTLLGLPAIVSASCPTDSSGGTITLLDPTGIAFADEGLRFETTEQGMVELDDLPTGATDTPTSASATIISVFQVDGVLFKMTRATNWANGRTGGVVCVTGAAYTGVSA
jgi:hypothetical protein